VPFSRGLVYGARAMAWASRSDSTQRALVFALVVSVASWSPVSSLRAQAPGVVVPAGEAAQPAQAAEAAEEPAAPAPLDDVDEPAAEPVSAGDGGRAELQKQLQALEREREDTTNLWPWLTVGLGVTTVLAGTIAGVANSFACGPDEAGCHSPPWGEAAVVAGALIGTLGAIWLVNTDRGIAELELKKTQLKYDMDRLEAGRARRNGLARGSASQLRLTIEF
jgi:hypothetical protein